MSTTDITVILACRNQGRFLDSAVKSVAQSIASAQAELDVSIEWIACADTSSKATSEYLEQHLPSPGRCLFTNEGELASAKNQAVKEATGQLIALVGGDDLISSNWLSTCFKQSADKTRQLVLHPASVIVFGKECFLSITPDQDDPDFSSDVLLEHCPWPSTSFGAKEIFSTYKFIAPDRSRGFGHPDWHWSCETLSGGVIHKPVPGTLSCCRRSEEHACIAHDKSNSSLIPPTRLLHPFCSQVLSAEQRAAT